MKLNKSKLDSNIETLNYGVLSKLQETKDEVTYKQLCECLEIPYLYGNSKRKQLAEINSVCDIEKVGTKFKIVEIRSNREILLFNNRAIYLPYIELILLSAFEKSNDDILYLSTKEIVGVCNMVNKNYKALLNRDMFSKSKAVAEANQFNHAQFYEYLDKGYNSVLRPIVSTALKSMDKRKSISLNKGFKAYLKSGATTVYSYHLETDEFGKELFQIEGETFNELGIDGVGELFGSKKTMASKFYSLCNTKAQERTATNQTWIDNGWECDGFYRCHAILLNSARIKHCSETLKRDLNMKVQDKMLMTRTLDFLTGDERKVFIEATISKEGENKWDFNENIK